MHPTTLLLPILLPLLTTAQFIPSPPPSKFTSKTGHANITIRYKPVPAGICELSPTVKSYSGYADIAEDQHIFWWFFEAREIDPSEAPLTVWINGGPGSSSLIGGLGELGPCRILKGGGEIEGDDPDGDGELRVLDNEFSWSRRSNLLVVDQPAQVGFSYSIPVNGYINPDTGKIITLPGDTCPDYAQAFGTCGTYSYPNISLTANSTAGAAPGFWKTLQGFMGVFPEYSRNGFHFATESYGGHYGPIFNEYIEKQNEKNIPGAKKIKLESVLIGNGWYDPLIHYQAFYNFTVDPGNTYNYDPFNSSIKELLYNNLYGNGNCVDQVKDCYIRGLNEICAAADAFCADQVEAIYDNYLGRDEYDIRELTPDPFPYMHFVEYLNTPKVLEAIGAYQNFSLSSEAVWTAFSGTGDDDREAGTVEAIGELLDQGVTVMLYAGDADYNCNWLGGEVVANEVNAVGFDKAGYTDIITSDGIVHGQVKQAGNFSFARIYEAGHMVPFYQPLLSLEIFTRAINGLDIATGHVKVNEHENELEEYVYKTKGTAKTEYREGNGTMQWEVLPRNATFDFERNKPVEVGDGDESTMGGERKSVGQGVLRRRGIRRVGMKGRGKGDARP